jgi:DnaJ-class molecular chaperone
MAQASSSSKKASLYDILGVGKTATTTEIKKAYLKLARTHHPDKGGDPESFMEFAQASEVLTDVVRRRRYDELGVTDDGPGGGGQSGMGGVGGGFPFPFEMNVNLHDLFGNMFQGMGVGMPGMPPGAGGGGGPHRKGKKPTPTLQTVPVTLEQYYLGHRVEITIHRQAFCGPCDHTGAKAREICRRCHGSGSGSQVVQMGNMVMHTMGPCLDCQGKGQKVLEVCGVCAGSGFTNETRKLVVEIPAGARPNETFLFPEVCSDHPAFERPGDAHITLQEDPKDAAFRTFRRTGDQFQHLEVTAKMSLSEALLGTVIHLEGHPGYDEGLFVALPAGVFPGDVYVVDDLGMPLVREKGKYGELRIRVEVSVSEEERGKMAGQGADALRAVLGGLVRSPTCPVEAIQQGARRVIL